MTMLSGYGVLSITGAGGEVAEVYVPADTMVITTPDVRPAYTIRHEFDIDEMGLFELGEVRVRGGALMEAGLLTADMYARIPQVIIRRQEERDARWRAWEDRMAQGLWGEAGATAGTITIPEPVMPVVPHPTPAPTPGVDSANMTIAADYRYSLALLPDGSLWAWG